MRLYRFLNRDKEFKIKKDRLTVSAFLVIGSVIFVAPMIGVIGTKKVIILGMTYVLLSIFYFVRSLAIFDKH